MWNSNFVYAVCRGADVGDDYGLGAERKYHGSFGGDNSWHPWTFPFIWVSIFYTGRKILGSDYTEAANIDFAEVFAKAVKALINLDFDLFFNDIWPIVFPMMVGCIPFCIVVWTAAYYVIKMMIKPK